MRGVTIVEAVVAVAIFSIIASVAIASYTLAGSLSHRAANKTKALWLAEEGIEAARSIRDQNFTNLSAGTKGLSRSGTNWQFSGTTDTTDGFIRSLVVTNIDADSRTVQSNVSWSEHGATSTVTLTTLLTNWRKAVDAASHMGIDTSSACVYTLDPRYLGGVKLGYDGTVGTVTVSQIKVSWTPTTPARSLNQILAPYPTVVWTGAAVTGATSTLTTPVNFSSVGTTTFSFFANASISGKSFVIIFIMSDGTTKTATITSPLLSICL